MVIIYVSIDKVDCDHLTCILLGVRSGMASFRLQPPSLFDFRTPDEGMDFETSVSNSRIVPAPTTVARVFVIGEFGF